MLDLCDLALELPQSDRSRFLTDTCEGDEALRQAVETLLKAVEDSGSFLVVDEPIEDD